MFWKLREGSIDTLFPLDPFHTIFGLYLSYPLSWAFTLVAHIISMIILFRKTFKKRENKEASTSNK